MKRSFASRFAFSVSVVLLSPLALAFGIGCGGKKPPPPVEPQVAEVAADGGAGADAADDAAPPVQKPLIDRLGGRDGLVKVVDLFVAKAVADPTLKPAFAKLTDPKAKDKLEKFKTNFVDFLCNAANGPCVYKGKDMKAAHKDLKINDAQWDATVQVFTSALTDAGVAEADQSELLGKVAPLKDDVVTVKSKPAAGAPKAGDTKPGKKQKKHR